MPKTAAWGMWWRPPPICTCGQIPSGKNKRGWCPPHTAAPQGGMGNFLLNLNPPTESFVIFDECLATHPDDEGALLGKAVALQLSGDLQAAPTLCRRLLERSSASLECLANLTALGLQNSDFDLVRAAAERLLKLDADSEIALQGLGAAGLAAEEFAEAAKCYER